MLNVWGRIVSLDATSRPAAGTDQVGRKTKAGDVHTEAIEVAIVKNEVVDVNAGEPRR